MAAFFTKLISPAGLVVLVCFFLPWMSASCAGNSYAVITLSGYELSNDFEMNGQVLPGNPQIYGVAAGGAVLLLAGLFLWANRNALVSLLALGPNREPALLDQPRHPANVERTH